MEINNEDRKKYIFGEIRIISSSLAEIYNKPLQKNK